MPSCVACGAELEPPVRVPHAVYVKSLYRIAGQDHCRHHIIKAAVAASAITRVRAGVSPAPGSNPSGGFRRDLVEPDKRFHAERPVPPG